MPSDKVVIVDSLRNVGGDVTAMTGDGVNDAPALKHADVGTAMGISGTEVTKKSADLILLDDNFTTIVKAVKEGRRIYQNTQKYVVYNLSIKGGECLCTMIALIIGLPLPMRSLQQLFNLIVTHIIPPMSLAVEQPEDYVMKIPPRKTKGDLIVSRTMWVFKWLPFVCCFATTSLSCLMLGVWTHTGYLSSNVLIGSSRIGKLEAGRSACEFSGHLDEGGRLIEDARPFHCVCFVHEHGLPWEAVKEVEQWGRVVTEEELDSSFNRWNGDTGNLFDKSSTPWLDGRESLLTPCADHRGVQRWCWKEKDTSAEIMPVLPRVQQCAAYGTRLGQSMTYVAVHLGEILSLLTYRTDVSCFTHLFRNRVYNAMLLFNLTMLLVFIYVPHVSMLLGLAPLSAGRLLQAVCFPLLLVVLNELFKVIYRLKLQTENRILALEAHQRIRPHKKVEV